METKKVDEAEVVEPKKEQTAGDKIWAFTKTAGKVIGVAGGIAAVAFGALKAFQHFGGNVVVTLPTDNAAM